MRLRHLFFALALACSAFGKVVFATPVFNSANGHYYEEVAGTCTWSQANSAAEHSTYQSMQGHLVCITSASENDWIVQNLTAGVSGNYWIGGWQDKSTGATEPANGWQWVTGEPFTYTNWQLGEPNDNANLSPHEDGLQILSNGKFNDQKNTLNGYIVEYQALPGGRIAWEVTGDIYVYDADGTHGVNLTHSTDTDSWPSFSGDGSKIAYASKWGSSGFTSICLMNADGTNVQKLNFDPDNLDMRIKCQPSLSKDGTKIAYVVQPAIGGNGDIWIMNSDGSGQQQLTNTPTIDERVPVFSPDKSTIAYGVGSKLYLVNGDGTNPHLLKDVGESIGRITFHPSGLCLAFGSIAYTGECYANTINIDGSGFRMVQQGLGGYDPSYSPDGSLLVGQLGYMYSPYGNWVTRPAAVSGINPSWVAPATPVSRPVSFTNPQVAEGDVPGTAASPKLATFTVKLGSSSLATVRIDYKTVDGTAFAGQDYLPVSGTLVFAPGESDKTVDVPIVGDLRYEKNEKFYLQLTINNSANTNDVLTGITTNYAFITDDDPQAAGSGKIAFDSQRDGNSEIYVMSGDGTNQTNLTNNPSSDAKPSISPDGTKIAFASNRNGHSQIYLMNDDGSNVVRIGDGNGEDSDPAWSPSGQEIAFVSQRDGATDIYRMNADGSNILRLVTSPDGKSSSAPSYSPDGATVVFQTDRDGDLNIYKVGRDGSGLTKLTTDAGEDTSPVYSSDGTKIAFTTNRSGSRQIYTMGTNGASQVSLTSDSTSTTNVESADHASYSTDGTKIAFTGRVDDGAGEICTLNTDGSGLATLTNNMAEDAHPTWGVGDVAAARPVLSASNISVVEGSKGTFTIKLSAASAQKVRVQYATQDITASAAANDYTAVTGTLTFNAGVTQQTVTIAANTDGVADNGETFALNLTGAENAKISATPITGTIIDAVRPDLSIKGSAPSVVPYIADGVFEPTAVAANTLQEKVASEETATFIVNAQNLGTARSPLVLKCSEKNDSTPPAGAEWAVSFFVGDTDITSQVKSSAGYTTQELEPGAAEVVTIKVTPNAYMVLANRHWVNVTAYLPDGVTPCDTVSADTLCTVRKPDIYFQVNGQTSKTGENVISADAVGEEKTNLTPSTQKITYLISVKNSGQVVDTFHIASAGGTAGWNVKFLTASDGTDITSAVTQTDNGVLTGWETPPVNAASTTQIKLEVTPDGTVPFGSTLPITVKAWSSTVASKLDAIKVVTKVAYPVGPDLQVKRLWEDDGAYYGIAIYQAPPGSAQTNVQSINRNISVRFQVKLRNTTDSPQTYVLRTDSGTVSGWTKTISLASQDVTAQMLGTDGLSRTLAGGASEIFTVDITPGASAADGSSYSADISVYPNATETTAQDAVRCTGTLNSGGGSLVFNPANGHYYEEVTVTGGINWPQSRQQAAGRVYNGFVGHLTTLTSAEENQFVKTSFPTGVNGQYWFGGYQDSTAPDFSEPAGGWRWVTGEEFDYTQWRPGEPNEQGGGKTEDSLHMIAEGWNDWPGTNTRTGYFVEYGANDLVLPKLNIADASVIEGNAGTKTLTFTVTMSQASDTPVTVHYATQNGAATTPDDYEAASGDLTFAPGETSKTIDVTVKGDTAFEIGEDFSVVLSAPVGARIKDGVGVGTIINDEPAGEHGGKIVFQSGRDGNDEIYVMNADGTAQTDLSNNSSANDQFPFWRPDGTAIAYSRRLTVGNGGADVYTMDADGSNVLARTTDGPDDLYPSFYTGDKMLYSSFGGFDYDVFTIPAGTLTDRTRIVNNTYGDYAPRLSPDGTRLSFHTYPDAATADIYVANADGTNQVRLTTASGHDANANWSPDSKKLVFASSRDGNEEIYVMNADGTAQTRLTNNAASDIRPCFSPDGSQIAFSSNRDGNYEIYIMNADGTNPVRVTNSAGDDTWPSWVTGTIVELPHLDVADTSITEGNIGEKQMLFTVRLNKASDKTVTVNYQTRGISAAPNADFYSASGSLTFSPGELEKQVAVRIIGDAVYEANETLALTLSGASRATIGDGEGIGTIQDDDTESAGGGKIAFSTNRDGDYEIYVMNADGTNPTNLTNYPSASDWTPAFSYDGSKIAFVSTRSGKYQIWAMNSDGSNQVQLTNDSGAAQRPAWSPDGTKIAFSSSRSGNFDIYIMNADGSNVTRIYASPAGKSSQMPCFSPNGARIAFNSTKDATANEIYSMNIDGSDLKRLTNNTATDYAPCYSRDGSKISFASQRNGTTQIWTMDVDGGNPTQISTGTAIEVYPTYSPDGTKIAFESYTGTNSIMHIFAVDASGANRTQLTTIPHNIEPSWASGALAASLPGITINDITMNEGEEKNFTVTLSAPSTQTVTLKYKTTDGTATVPADYDAASGQVEFAPGETQKTITVRSKNDSAYTESTEIFYVDLSGAINARIDDARGQASVVESPHADLLIKKIGEADALYALDGTYQTDPAGSQLDSQAANRSVTDKYAIRLENDSVSQQTFILKADETLPAGWTALYQSDNSDITGQLTAATGKAFTLAAGAGTVVTLAVTPGGSAEAGSAHVATFKVLANADDTVPLDTVRATTTLPVAPGQPAFSFDNGFYYEQVTIPGGLSWEEARDAARSRTYRGVTGHLVTITSATENQFVFNNLTKAIQDNYWIGGYQDKAGYVLEPAGDWHWVTGEPFDYTNWQTNEPNNGGGVGPSEDALHILLNGKWNDQVNSLKITGFIVEYEVSGGPTEVSVNDAAAAEGENAVFTVHLSRTSEQTVKVNYATQTGTAGASDFSATNGTLEFAPGETEKTVSVAVGNDDLDENDEAFSLVLSTPVNAKLGDAQGAGTIHDATIFQADLLVKQDSQPDTAYAIDNEYQTEPAGEQIESATSAPNTGQTYDVKVENDGNATHSYVLKASESTGKNWTVTYKVGDTDITAAITGDGYLTAAIASGESSIIKVTVASNASAKGGEKKTVTIRASNGGGDNAVRDSVRIEDTLNSSYAPDLLIQGGSPTYLGDGVYNATGANQTDAQNIGEGGGTATYLIRLQNDGNSADTFKIKGSSAADGWTVHYFGGPGSTDVTADVTGDGWITPQIAAGSFTAIVAVVNSGNVEGGSELTLAVSAQSVTANDKADAIKAVTSVEPDVKVDALLKLSGEGSFAGDNIFQQTPAGVQLKSGVVNTGTPLQATYKIINKGNTTRSFFLAIQDNKATGWNSEYKIGDNDVTANITGDGITTAPIAPGGDVQIQVKLTPGAGATTASKTTSTVLVYTDDTKDNVIDAVGLSADVTASYGIDATIRNDDDATFVGGGVVNLTGEGQSKSQVIDAGAIAKYYLRIENKGNSADTFKVSAPVLGTGWSAKYFSGDTDITSAVNADGGFATPSLAAGASLDLRLEIKPNSNLAGGAAQTTLVTVTSVGDGEKRDTVKATATVGQQLDLLIKKDAEGESAYAIDNTYQSEPAGNQIESELMTPNGTLRYQVKIQNDGLSSHTFKLKASESDSDNWSVAYKTGDTDITAAIKGQGYTTQNIAAGESQVITVELSAGPSAKGGEKKSVTVRAYNDGDDTTVRDAVRIENTLDKNYLADLLIQGGAPSYVGDGIYNGTGANQSDAQAIANNAKATYLIKLQNDGNSPDTFKVQGGGSADGWTVRYYNAASGGTEITSDITGAGWTTNEISSGGAITLRVEVSSGNVEGGSERALLISAQSVTSQKTDAVKATTSVAVVTSVDALVKLASDNAFAGEGVIQQTPSGVQLKSGTVETGTPLSATYKVVNKGNATRTFFLKIADNKGTGWASEYKIGGTDYTGSLTTDGLTTAPIAPGGSLSIEAKLTPDSGASPSANALSSLLVFPDDGEGDVSDAVGLSATVPASYGVEASIRNEADSSFVGGGVVNITADNQTKSQSVAAGATVRYYFRIENKGNVADTFKVTAPALATGWSAQYFNGGTNITASVNATAGFVTPSIAPGGNLELRLEIKPANTIASAAVQSALVTVASVGNSTKRDSVKATATVFHQPDALIKKSTEADTAYALDNTYQLVPSGDQVETQTANPATKLTYLVRIQNDSGVSRTFVAKTVEGAGDGWTIVYKVGTTDVSTALRSATGRTTATLAANAAEVLTIEMTPGTGVVRGAPKNVTINLYEKNDGIVRDAVQAVAIATPASGRQPDAQVRATTQSSYLGVDILNADGTSQTATQSTRNAAAAVYFFNIVNDGNVAEAIKLTADKAPTNWTVKYIDTATSADITTAITGTAGWTTPSLAIGAARVVRMDLTPGAAIAGGAKSTLQLTATSTGDSTKKDQVKTTTEVLTTSGVDALVSAVNTTTMAGDGIYNSDGTGQTNSQTVARNTKLVYYVRLQNEGNLADQFKVTGLPGGTNWTLKYFNDSGNADITTAVTGSGWLSPSVAANATVTIRMEITASTAVPVGTVKTIPVTAVSNRDASKKDTVKTVTTTK